MEILHDLFAMRDAAYRDFSAKLLPNIPAERVIGVRMPALRKYAKRIAGETATARFLSSLPHTYQEENLWHMILLGESKSFEDALGELGRFLPYVDNWAVCDCPPPRVFEKSREALLPWIRALLESGKTYSVRYGIGLLMRYFLTDLYSPEYPRMVAAVKERDYYVRMMVAWYFATALAFRFEEILPYLAERRLEPWIHAKTISKAIESYRLSPEQKSVLRRLR